MIGTKRNQPGFSTVEIVLAILVTGAIVATGLLLYQRHWSRVTSNTTDSTIQQKSTTATQTQPNPYAGWKTYTLAEDSTISFKYPADWTVVADAKDTSSTPYNHFVKITDPNLYHDNAFVFIFRYSPGQSNQLTKECSNGTDTNSAKSEYLTVSNKKVRLITRTFAIVGVSTVTMALTDTTNGCYVSVPSGVIEANENLGSESAPTYGIDLNAFNSLSEAETFNLIFRSIKF